MPNQCRAWLLDLGQGRYTAVGHQHMMEFVTETPMFEIPLAPRYCTGVMLWRHNIVPIIDINRLVGATSDSTCEHKGVGIMAYQQAPGEPLRYGGLLLEAEPREVAVSDDMASPLPASPGGWQAISLSCFSLDGQPVPILHIGKIFEERFPREAVPESFATEYSAYRDAAETPTATDDAMATSAPAITGVASEVSTQSNRTPSEPPPVIAVSGAGLELDSAAAADHSQRSEMVVDRSTSEPLISETAPANGPPQTTSGAPILTESERPESDPHQLEQDTQPCIPGKARAARSNETSPMPGEGGSSINPVVSNEVEAPSAPSGAEPAPGEDGKPVESSTAPDEPIPVAPATHESGEAADPTATRPPRWLSDWRARVGRS